MFVTLSLVGSSVLARFLGRFRLNGNLCCCRVSPDNIDWRLGRHPAIFLNRSLFHETHWFLLGHLFSPIWKVWTAPLALVSTPELLAAHAPLPYYLILLVL
jgi:hypothetical protein